MESELVQDAEELTPGIRVFYTINTLMIWMIFFMTLYIDGTLRRIYNIFVWLKNAVVRVFRVLRNRPTLVLMFITCAVSSLPMWMSFFKSIHNYWHAKFLAFLGGIIQAGTIFIIFMHVKSFDLRILVFIKTLGMVFLYLGILFGLVPYFRNTAVVSLLNGMIVLLIFRFVIPAALIRNRNLSLSHSE